MQPSAFDVLLDSYWQDYQLKLPVAGGMAYQEALYTCQLDDSLDSLKRLDRLLLGLKKQLVGHEKHLLAQEEFRHFMLFVAYYAGRVLANHGNRRLSWQKLAIKPSAPYASFYTAMAAVDSQDKQLLPFFGVLVLGAKLFGRFDYKFTHPMTGQLMPESLYWAVMAYLDDNPPQLPPPQALSQASAQVSKPSAQATDHHALPVTQKPVAQKPVVQATTKQSPSEPLSSTQLDKPLSQQPSSERLSNTPISSPTPSLKATEQVAQALHNNQSNHQPSPTITKPSPRTKPKPKPYAYLDEVKADLVQLPASHHSHQAHYDKAAAVINALTHKLTAMPSTDVKALGNQERQLLRQALQLMMKLTQSGNTNAMLSLAVVYFEGIFITQDTQKATAMVQKAADMGDMRAQKLLSRLYYQGVGVKASTIEGERWLAKAAESGHPQAQALQQQFAHIRLMQDDARLDKQQDKRYLWGAVGIGLFVGFILWLLAKFFA